MSITHFVLPKPCPQDWDEMEPAGRTRFCLGCNKHVHDLQQYTAEEADELLGQQAAPACVRALIEPEGRVRIRPSLADRGFTAAVIAPALAAFLITAPAAAASMQGVIAGTVGVRVSETVRVTALAPGVKRSTRTDPEGRYAIDNLPPGNYRLLFSAPGGHKWSIDNVPVSADGLTVRSSSDPAGPSQTEMTIGQPIAPKAIVGEAIMPPVPVPPS